MNNFWERKKQELQEKGELPVSRPEPVKAMEGPWWAEGSRIIETRPRSPENPLQVQLEPSGIVEGHNISKANHLKASGNCPMCDSGNYMRVSQTSPVRCFDCGYSDGRDTGNNDGSLSVITSGVKTLNVKQTAQGGANRNNIAQYNSADDINSANYQLEQSALGKAKI